MWLHDNVQIYCAIYIFKNNGPWSINQGSANVLIDDFREAYVSTNVLAVSVCTCNCISQNVGEIHGHQHLILTGVSRQMGMICSLYERIV